MGRSQADGFASAVDDGLVGQRDALRWHLQANHYPPHPSFMIDVAEEALGLIASGHEDLYVDISDLPITHRIHGTQVPPWVIVEELHLESFVRVAEEEVPALEDQKYWEDWVAERVEVALLAAEVS